MTVFNINHHREEIEELRGIRTKAKRAEREVTGAELTDVIIDRLMDLSPMDFEEFTLKVKVEPEPEGSMIKVQVRSCHKQSQDMHSAKLTGSKPQRVLLLKRTRFGSLAS